MRVVALVRVLGLRPGEEADVDLSRPDVLAALNAELVEEVTAWTAAGGGAMGRRDGQ